MPKFTKIKLLSDKEINIIAIVGKASPEELMQVFGHWDIIEQKMYDLDCDDCFGTEGWKHMFGHPDAD
jgi:hypothetical protein